MCSTPSFFCSNVWTFVLITAYADDSIMPCSKFKSHLMLKESAIIAFVNHDMEQVIRQAEAAEHNVSLIIQMRGF